MKEPGQGPPGDVVALIDSSPTVWVHVAAVRQEDQWNATHVEMTSSVVPESWVLRRWAYDDIIFLSCTITGSEDPTPQPGDPPHLLEPRVQGVHTPHR